MPLTPENVESYPVTPLIEPVPDEIVVRLGGVDILRTVWGLRVLKRGQAPTYYLPLEDLRADLLALPGEGMCAWCAQAYAMIARRQVAPRTPVARRLGQRRRAAEAGLARHSYRGVKYRS